MRNFRELDIWKSAMELAQHIYLLCRLLPSEERFGLSSQLQRSAISIPSNIAEGAGRNHAREFVQFLHVAMASSFELETQLILANKLGYTTENDTHQILEKLTILQKQLNAFIKTQKSKLTPNPQLPTPNP
jgi:four helix bundle protein